MASPTAIPHPETSSHHTDPQQDDSSSFPSSNYSRSPTDTSPKPLISPIYTSAGRSAFSLPGPNSTAKSPTTTSWYSAGFSSNSQRVRSPTQPFGTVNASAPPHRVEYFPDSMTSPSATATATATATGMPHARNHSGASRSSSFSSSELSASFNEPSTPKANGEAGYSLGRVPSLPMGTSYEQLKNHHRGSWGGSQAWGGLGTFRGHNSPPMNPDSGSNEGSGGGGGGGGATGGMGGLLRKFSIGSAPLKTGHSRSVSAYPTTTSPVSGGGGGEAPIAPNEVSPIGPVNAEPLDVSPRAESETKRRGRQSSVSGGSQRRRPSPMGERLLMGHFNAH